MPIVGRTSIAPPLLRDSSLEEKRLAVLGEKRLQSLVPRSPKLRHDALHVLVVGTDRD